MSAKVLLVAVWGVLTPVLAQVPSSAAPKPSVATPATLSPTAKEGVRLAQRDCPSDGFDKARCARAIALLEEAANENPNQQDVQLALAQAYWNTSFRESPQGRSRGDLRQRSLDIYQRQVELGSKDARPYWELSLRQKDEAQRLPLLRRTVELNPVHPQANRELARTELSVGEVDAAVLSYQKHLEVSPYRDSSDALAHLDFAKQLEGAGRPKDAAQVTERVSTLMQGERRATRCEVWRSADPKLYAQKAELSKKVKELLPYCTETASLEQAAELERQGRVDEAIVAAKRQLEENPKPEATHVMLERLYQSKGEPAQAAQVATQTLEQEPDAKEKCERFRELAPTTVRAMPQDQVEALRRDCHQP
ncbi:tetratricopeptide repeat protein [Myxococcus sp. CA033]|uniref:tetratricopeptide repeat protein n=1 Tax=Myxococcus sp. CA033 TaxID=2741516 RepID=UPI00157B9D33|nr:tetratricopeptide repeat protein [Myxococcus sp. CA033]NTX37822.1 tetratricopeptide repeat protein [Myxococcus sp. CA033]